MSPFTAAVALLTFVFIIGVFAGWSSSVYPVVQFSWSTGECIEVIGTAEFDCINMPEKYIHEWVK